MNENQTKFIKKDAVFLPLKIALAYCLILLSNISHSQVYLDDSSTYTAKSINGAATWAKDATTGNYVYNNGGTQYTRRAVLYSTAAYQSNDGFKLTIQYTTGSIGDSAAHNFSFGLISSETDLATYSGYNPFKAETSVYSIGANLTADDDITARGLNFTNKTSRTTLDQSGTRSQFETGATTKVTIEIGIGGYWSYRINDVYEASGVLASGIDLTKSFRVAIYGQDDNGGGKSIQSIKLEKRYAAGERAANLKGTWFSGIDPDLLDDRIKNLKTLDGLGVSFTDGATLSAQHYAPQKLLETIAAGSGVAIVPTWGDLSLDEPVTDPYLEDVLKVRAAGFKVKAYTNSETFVGTNSTTLQVFVDLWKNYCDTNAEMQAFINSQPFHTGIWNATTKQYEDASTTYPNRKYMFCYAEFVLKDYALRYGKYIDNWIFDDGGTMEENGDNATSGLIEEQRIYQAFTNAVHAGNPEIPTAFNNGRSTTSYDAYPYAQPVQFEDFTFGHGFGGNNDHASKTGGQFYSNYKYITRMTETNGSVHNGGNWTWDDKIVGNFHSKLSTTAWKYGPTQAWEQADFNQWNLEAMKAGASMTWDGSFNKGVTAIYSWVYTLLEGMDAYLAANQSPGAPNWARAYTILPTATAGQTYYHVLTEGVDFWDPEGDAIQSLVASGNYPSWLIIQKIATGVWGLKGTPTEITAANYDFNLKVSDATGGTSRAVNLKVIANTSKFSDNKQLAIDKQDNVMYYPNPVKDILNYDFKDNTGITHVSIYSLLGSQISTHKIESTVGQINLQGLASGIYILKTSGESDSIVTKFIKE